MKKFLFGLVALVAIAIAVIILLPSLIPVSTYKNTIEEQVSNAIGRKVTIGDDLSIKIFPKTAFGVSELQIDNPDGFSSPYLMRVEKARIGVDLFKLLSKEIQINQFVLTNPDIHLQKTKSGKVNWELGGDEKPAETSSNDGADAAASLNDIRLGDVRIVDGKASYNDAQAKSSYKLDDIDVDITLDSLTTPFVVRGTMNFQDKPARVDLAMTTLGDFLKNQDTNVKFSMDVGQTDMGGDLKLSFNDKKAMSFSGPVSFSAPDLPEIAALGGSPLPEAPGFDNFSVSGQLSGNPDLVKLSDAKIKFDEIDAAGDLQLRLSGRRPKASGTLTTALLDLRPYMPAPTETAAGFPAWSEEKLDLSSLRNIDTDLNISTDSILVNNINIGASQLALKINNGVMTADIPTMAMYKGNGSGRLVVNARNTTPSFSGKFNLGKVDAEPFCIDVFAIDRLLGLGGFNLNFEASGASQAAIMRSVDGSGGFDVSNGALKGINIGKIARTASSFKAGVNPNAVVSAVTSARGNDETTDFSSFLSKFSMNNGIMSVSNIDMSAPLLSMVGSGTVNLPQQTIDISLQPTASLNTDGTGGSGVAVPIRVTGTFSNPKYSVDLQALLKGAAGSRLRGVIDGALGDKIKDSPANGLLDGALDGVFGGGGGGQVDAGAATGSTAEEATAGATAAPASAEDAVEDLAKSALGSLFGSSKKKESKEEDSD